MCFLASLLFEGDNQAAGTTMRQVINGDYLIILHFVVLHR
jgi:hypothetical protein